MNIKEFCDKHHAGSEVREWALANCNTMQEAWDKCPRVTWMIWMATRPGVLDDKSLRLFAIWCCRQVQHLMKDPRSIAAIDAAEQFVNGLISPEQLTAAQQLANNAAAADADAAAAAADAAADAAAYAYAARAAAYAAAADAYAYAARAAAYAAAADAYAAYAAAYAARAAADVHKAAESKQMEYLRQNTKPNFE